MKVAPFGPHNGLVTSQATRKLHSFSSGITWPARICATSFSASASIPTGFPDASRNSYPSTVSMPIPQSLVALPPIPTIKSRHPPFHRIPDHLADSVRRGVQRLFLFSHQSDPRRGPPSPSPPFCFPRIHPYEAVTGVSIGPCTFTCASSPAQSLPDRASVVPSPPVCQRLTRTWAFGSAFRTPSFIAFPASIELRLPFKESIAITTFITLPRSSVFAIGLTTFLGAPSITDCIFSAVVRIILSPRFFRRPGNVRSNNTVFRFQKHIIFLDRLRRDYNPLPPPLLSRFPEPRTDPAPQPAAPGCC